MELIELSHCRNKIYREFAHKTLKGVDFPNRDGTLPELRRLRFDPIKNVDNLNYMLHRFRNRPGLYVSVYAFTGCTEKGVIDYGTAQIDRLYLDFDSKENPQLAIDEALLMVRVLAKNKIYCHCYFSGKKGIAMYLDFEPIKVESADKKELITFLFDLFEQEVYNSFENFFGLWIPTTTKGFGVVLETLDHQVRGDISRVSRIPNTKHASGKYCIPISFGDMRRGINHILALADHPSETDLGRTISACIKRNSTMKNIVNNAIKIILRNRTDKLLQSNIKKNQIKRLPPKKKALNIIDDRMIKAAKTIPLSEYMGNDTKIICPFHNDSAPSLSIDHSKGVWHCFGCGKSGDIITFVMEKCSLNFKEAILKLTGQELQEKKEPRTKEMKKSRVPIIHHKKANKSDSVPPLSTSDQAILDFLKENPNKTTKEIAEGTSISIPNLQMYLMELVNDEYILQSDDKDAEFITFSIPNIKKENK